MWKVTNMSHNEIINKIELLFQEAEHLPANKKQLFLRHLNDLKKELNNLPSKKNEQAKSIANFTNLAANESLRKDKDPVLLDLSLKGLEASIRDFETSHPVLTENTYSFINLLSNLGV